MARKPNFPNYFLLPGTDLIPTNKAHTPNTMEDGMYEGYADQPFVEYNWPDSQFVSTETLYINN